MHPMLNIAVRAARNAGNLIIRYSTRIDSLTITSKQKHDFVSEVDRQAEEEIIKVLLKAYPDHGIIAEESGEKASDSEFTWIIDPLDGTTNFLHEFPQYCVSIALKKDKLIEQAVIYDPTRNELFTASRGSGAQLDGRRIRVSKQTKLDGSLIGTGFPFRSEIYLDAYLKMFRDISPRVADIRRAGSAALDLAYVAAGRLDGFWEIGLSPWDMAAGALLVSEAGGFVTDFDGGSKWLETGNIVVGTPKVCPALVAAIQPHLIDGIKR